MAEADRRTQEATGINEGLRRLKGDLPWRMDPKWQMAEWVSNGCRIRPIEQGGW